MMAKTPQNTSTGITNIIVAIIFFFFSTVTLAIGYNIDSKYRFSKNLSPKKLGLSLDDGQKLSHLHFYFHDIVSGRNPTAVKVAAAQTTNTSSTGFGFVFMMDDPLTVGPDRASKLVGRAQGIYASASRSDVELLMVVNYVFTEGKYNGSTLSILGRNAVFSTVRELPIVGGSGLFRFARGYAQERTHAFDAITRNAVVEYNIFVLHY